MVVKAARRAANALLECGARFLLLGNTLILRNGMLGENHSLMTVFIGGSRAVSRLNEDLRARLDDFIQPGCTIFVGDANGADKAVQQHLAARGHPQVVVYCMDRRRNNVEGWPIKQIDRPDGIAILPTTPPNTRPWRMTPNEA